MTSQICEIYEKPGSEQRFLDGQQVATQVEGTHALQAPESMQIMKCMKIAEIYRKSDSSTGFYKSIRWPLRSKEGTRALSRLKCLKNHRTHKQSWNL